MYSTKHSSFLMDHLYKNPSIPTLACFTPSPSAMFFKLGPFPIHYIRKCDRIPAMALKMIHYTQCKGRGKLYPISFHKFMPARVLVAGITWFADLCSPHTHAVEAPLSIFLLLSPLLQHPSVQIHKGGSLQGTNRMDSVIGQTLRFIVD